MSDMLFNCMDGQWKNRGLIAGESKQKEEKIKRIEHVCRMLFEKINKLNEL